MYCDGIAPQFMFSSHNNEKVEPTLVPKDNWPATPQNSPDDLSRKLACVLGPVQPTCVCLETDADQLAWELFFLCQATWVAYVQSQHLHHIVRPLLPHATWDEANEAARHGGQALPTQIKEATILWLDVAHFAELTNAHTLDQVVTDLNAYLDALTQLVYRHQGDVNKYMGDGFLAVFANADDALQAACALQKAAADFNRRQVLNGKPALPTRIGIDTGQVALTSLGSCERQDRTVIGIPVNRAKRIQQQALIGQVWLSQATFQRLQDRSGLYVVGEIEIKGQQEPVFVYARQAAVEDNPGENGPLHKDAPGERKQVVQIEGQNPSTA